MMDFSILTKSLYPDYFWGFVSHRFTDPLSSIPESGKGRVESDGGDTEPRILFLDSSIPLLWLLFPDSW
jgi:hypothetical protein